MSGVRLLAARDRTARPWKNGGGLTGDVVVFPAGAEDEDFLWRASVATIAAAGPFSPFPGVDRTLMLLDGELVIKIGESAHRLRPGSAARSFAGDDCVSAAPVGSACTVLNLMVRRGAFSASLGRWTAAPTTRSADQLLLFATHMTRIGVGEDMFDLSPTDALLVDAPAGLSLSIDRPVIAAELFRTPTDQFVQ